MNWLPYFAGLLLAALLAIGALLALALHKIRRIHLSTYDIKPARVETEALFAQIQSLLALERILGMPSPLPPLRGWAGSPDFLLNVAQQLQQRQPATVLECSSGVSTIVSARMMQLNGKGHVYSLEHDPVFAAKTRALLEQFDVNAWATVIDAPLVSRESSSPWYSLDGLPKALTTIDALVVDGPPASGAPLARYPALPRFADKMSAGAIVIVDDAQRPDETRMLQKWATEFPEFKQSDLYCEKGCILLQRSALTLPH
jgi:predicted O-methyltransferase YrrM